MVHHTVVDLVPRGAYPTGLRRFMRASGSSLTYNQAFNSLKRTNANLFVGDGEQFIFLESYVEFLNRKKHFAVLEKCDSNFKRLAIVYREGLQANSKYYKFGLHLDGTHIKSSTQGVLLVACFKDGNNNIRILSVGLCSVENEDNWKWFIEFLVEKLEPKPPFAISDRDKGLLNALSGYPEIFHAYCFRHVMANFNNRFKNKELKNLCWGLAKAMNAHDFYKIKSEIPISPSAWLSEIGLPQICLLYSPIRRYGIVTSNNVEIMNNKLLQYRKMPVVDMLLGIEKVVVSDFLGCHESVLKWDSMLTKHAEDKLSQRLGSVSMYSTFPTTPSDHIVECHKGIERGRSFQVSTTKPGFCSCGEVLQTEFPCVHLLRVLNENGMNVLEYCGELWTKEVYEGAFTPFSESFPLTIFEDLRPSTLLPMVVKQQRVRPKENRIESQQSTLDLDKRTRQYRCSKCRGGGHRVNRCPN